ncbi:MAG TPA: hypothetical protein VK177_01185 [Flavobacteriales bacterium]|nr:hypothetical protein [Flavobacteriales bacterium]
MSKPPCDDIFCAYEDDTACQTEIEEAKAEIKRGKIYFCNYQGMSGPPRYDAFIREAAKEFKLEYRDELVSDVVVEGIEENCFCRYMDTYRYRHFPKDIEEKIEKKADSLFMLSLSTDTIEAWDCDVRIDETFIYESIDRQINYKNISIERNDREYPFVRAWFVIDTTGKMFFQDMYWVDSTGLDEKEMLNLGRQFAKAAKKTKTTFVCNVLKRKTNAYYTLQYWFDPPGENDPLFIRCEERDLEKGKKAEDQGYLFDDDFFQLKNGYLNDPDYASGVVIDGFKKSKLNANTWIVECDRTFSGYTEGKEHFYFLVKFIDGLFYQVCQASFPSVKLKSSEIVDDMIWITDVDGAISMMEILNEGFLFQKRMFTK